MTFTHMNQQGYGKMVDVGDKDITHRIAKAQAKISMTHDSFRAIQLGHLKKGDVLAVAQVAGIQAVKRCADLIPMAHPLLLSGIDIDYQLDETTASIQIICTVRCDGKTGVEMEALMGASVCALTIYDMAKALDKSMRIDDVYVLEKIGGKSGHYQRTTKEAL